ncbi:hypothetical protein H8959_022121 [Pygathrix nigripes]
MCRCNSLSEAPSAGVCRPRALPRTSHAAESSVQLFCAGWAACLCTLGVGYLVSCVCSLGLPFCGFLLCIVILSLSGCGCPVICLLALEDLGHRSCV